jgi:hypothetical protein
MSPAKDGSSFATAGGCVDEGELQAWKKTPPRTRPKETKNKTFPLIINFSSRAKDPRFRSILINYIDSIEKRQIGMKDR